MINCWILLKCLLQNKWINFTYVWRKSKNILLVFRRFNFQLQCTEFSEVTATVSWDVKGKSNWTQEWQCVNSEWQYLNTTPNCSKNLCVFLLKNTACDCTGVGNEIVAWQTNPAENVYDRWKNSEERTNIRVMKWNQNLVYETQLHCGYHILCNWH